MALLAVIFGLISAIAWGIADFAAAKASKSFGGLTTGVLVTAISALVFDVVYALFFRSHTTFNETGLGYALASGMAFTIANLAFYKGLEYGPVSIVSPLGSMYPLVTTLLLVLLFGSSLHFRQAIGIVVVMLGVAVASGVFKRVRGGHKLSRGPLLGMCGAFFWGLAWTCIAQAVKHIGWQLTAAVELTCSTLLFVPLLPLLNRAEHGLSRKLLLGIRNVLMITAGLLMMLGFLALSIGIDRVGNLVATAVVISACYPLITVFLALRRLKEELQPIPLAGALAGVVGIVILSLG